MKKVGVVLAALVLLAGMTYASAFAESASVNVSVTANPKLTIQTSTSAVNFGAIDPDTPTTVSNAVTVTVKSNKPFDYSYTATDFSSGTDSFAISNLEYNDGSGWVAFSNGGVLGTNIGRGVKQFSYDYRVTIPWDVPPGAYNATITYTAVQR